MTEREPSEAHAQVGKKGPAMDAVLLHVSPSMQWPQKTQKGTKPKTKNDRS
jgi:hypothetical protein